MTVRPIRTTPFVPSETDAAEVPVAGHDPAGVEAVIVELEQARSQARRDAAEHRRLAFQERHAAIAKERKALKLGFAAQLVQDIVGTVLSVVARVDGISDSVKGLVGHIGQGVGSIVSSVLGFVSQKREVDARTLEDSANGNAELAASADEAESVAEGWLRALWQEQDAMLDAEGAAAKAAFRDDD